MNNNKQIQKQIQHVSLVINKILNVLKKLNHNEKTGNYDNDFYMKNINLLQELLEHEKSLSRKICQDPLSEKIILDIIDNPSNFQMEHNIKGKAFSRFFRNMFIYNDAYEGEANINILNMMPEYAHLEFRLLEEDYSQLFKAFSEDLFNVYMSVLDEKIVNMADKKMRDKLIDEKYNIFAMYANTNEKLVNQDEKERVIESKLAQAIVNEDIDERVEKFLVADFSYNLGDEIFTNLLQVDNESYERVEKQKDYQLRLVLLESLLVFHDYEMREKMENLFYRKHYQSAQDEGIKNDKIAKQILQSLQHVRVKKKLITI